MLESCSRSCLISLHGCASLAKQAEYLSAMGLFTKVRWGILDCVTGVFTPVSKLPFHMGASEDCSLRLPGGLLDKHCAIAEVPGVGLCIRRHAPDAELIVNGTALDYSVLQPETDYSLKLGSHLLVLH